MKKRFVGSVCAVVICFLGCTKTDPPKVTPPKVTPPEITPAPAPVGFASPSASIKAGQEYFPVKITFGSALPEGAQVGVSVTLSSGLTQGANQMVEFLPAAVDNVITLSGNGT